MKEDLWTKLFLNGDVSSVEAEDCPYLPSTITEENDDRDEDNENKARNERRRTVYLFTA